MLALTLLQPRWGFLSRLAGSLAVPTGVNQLTQTLDPVERDTRGDGMVDAMWNRIKSRIPGVSDSLPARVDAWGQNMVRQGGVGPDIASPIRTRNALNDAAIPELLEAGANVGRPSRRIGGRKLAAREYNDYQRLSGQYLREDLLEARQDPNWQDATSEERKDWFDRMSGKLAPTLALIWGSDRAMKNKAPAVTATRLLLPCHPA